MRKKDVYPLDPLSGLRTNQQFSSFKLKIHTETAKSMVFGRNLPHVFLAKICTVFMKTMDFRRKSTVAKVFS